MPESAHAAKMSVVKYSATAAAAGACSRAVYLSHAYVAMLVCAMLVCVALQARRVLFGLQLACSRSGVNARRESNTRASGQAVPRSTDGFDTSPSVLWVWHLQPVGSNPDEAAATRIDRIECCDARLQQPSRPHVTSRAAVKSMVHRRWPYRHQPLKHSLVPALYSLCYGVTVRLKRHA